MNKIRIFMVTFMLMLFLFVGIGSANEQSVVISTSYAEYNEGGNITGWTQYPEEDKMKVGDTVYKDYATKSIKLMELSDELAIFKVTISGTTETIRLIETQSRNIQDLKIHLMHIVEFSSDYTNTDEDDVPVRVWIEPSENDEKHLTANGINSFNPVKYGSDNGWTTTYEKEEVILFVERIDTNKDVTFDMESDGNYERQIEDDKIKYYLRSNGEYKFTTKYVNLGTWGGETDIEDTYIISISGLGESVSSTSTSTTTNNDIVVDTTTPIVEGNYNINFGNTKNIITDVDGEWTIGNGINVDVNIQEGKYVWTFDFTEAGRYSPEFESENGEKGYVNFNVKDINENVNANQVQPINNNDNAIGKVIFVLGIIGLVGIGLYYANNKKKTKMSLANTVKENDENLVE